MAVTAELTPEWFTNVLSFPAIVIADRLSSHHSRYDNLQRPVPMNQKPITVFLKGLHTQGPEALDLRSNEGASRQLNVTVAEKHARGCVLPSVLREFHLLAVGDGDGGASEEHGDCKDEDRFLAG